MTGPPPAYIPPPPPPPMPPGGWAPPKPTSGKAIASLVCGLVGFIVFCYLPGIAALVGLVLGVLGLFETGREGTRSGRGLAIAGVIVCALAVAANIGWVGFLITMGRMGEREQVERSEERIDHDQALLLERIQKYCKANGDSLGPGGPVLALDVPDPRDEFDGGPVSNRRKARPLGGKVAASLKIEDLVGENELQWSRRRGGSGWELVVTGQKTATLRAKHWNGDVLRDIEITDAARGDWHVIAR